MDWARALVGTLVLVAVVVGAVIIFNPPLWLVSTGEYERATITAVDANGTTLDTIEARIADTTAKQRVGLSRTESLPMDEGMLFVFDGSGPHSFHMPDGMAFPLDIVFASDNGTVTTIHHAPLPSNAAQGTDARYTGRGRFVLEANRGWANATGLAVGDRLVIPTDVD